MRTLSFLLLRSFKSRGPATALLAGAALACMESSRAHDLFTLDEYAVEGRGTPLLGQAISASQGYVGRVDLEHRPLLRTGEVLESIPGLIVTQHSGSGKANQYFLRGFNLDHGTDFATWVDGMPVNMVTHGHGQGYSDLNFLIPELVDMISYYKGAYRPQLGDFSTSGSADIRTIDAMESGLAKVSIGEDGYLRTLLTNSVTVGPGDLLGANSAREKVSRAGAASGGSLFRDGGLGRDRLESSMGQRRIQIACIELHSDCTMMTNGN